MRPMKVKPPWPNLRCPCPSHLRKRRTSAGVPVTVTETIRHWAAAAVTGVPTILPHSAVGKFLPAIQKPASALKFAAMMSLTAIAGFMLSLDRKSVVQGKSVELVGRRAFERQATDRQDG